MHLKLIFRRLGLNIIVHFPKILRVAELIYRFIITIQRIFTIWNQLSLINISVSFYFYCTLLLSEDAPPPQLLQKIKEYSVKFVFPPTTKLPAPILGLHGKLSLIYFTVAFMD